MIVFMSSAVSEERNRVLSFLELICFIIISFVMIYELFRILIPFNRRLMDLFKQRKKEEEARQRLYQLAEVGELNFEILHEVNNYLTVSKGSADLITHCLKKSDDLNQETKEKLNGHIGKVNDGLKRIQGICSSMRELSRINTFNEFSFADLESDLKILLECSIKKEAIALKFINHDLGRIKSNRSQVVQVVYNLAKNAIHALEENIQDDREIAIEVSKHNEMVSIKVHDNGPGIPADAREKIMESFFTTKQPDKGTGLGLSLSRKIAKALGGDLELVDSDYSTCFEFTFKDYL